MKNSFKKFAAITLSSLGILAAMPSAFCSKETNERRTAPRNLNVSDRDYYEIENGRYVARNTTGRISVIQMTGDLVAGMYSKYLICGSIMAPRAAGTVKTNAFYGQSRLTSISLPSIKKIEAEAFDGCTSLQDLFLTNSLTEVNPRAFDGCNPDLIVHLNGIPYTINEFLEHFEANAALL